MQPRGDANGSRSKQPYMMLETWRHNGSERFTSHSDLQHKPSPLDCSSSVTMTAEAIEAFQISDTGRHFASEATHVEGHEDMMDDR
jgi:hypothetical protein